PAASPPNEIEALRQQVEALTETVKTLQQQVKDQQEALAKMNAVPSTLPANEPAAASPAPSVSAPPLFPTTDESVVASAPQPSALFSKASRTSFSSSIMTTKPRWKSKKRSCRRLICPLICNLKAASFSARSAGSIQPTRTPGISRMRRSFMAVCSDPMACAE